MKLLQNSGVPIYQQIADAFREEIIEGKRKQGEYLPFHPWTGERVKNQCDYYNESI